MSSSETGLVLKENQQEKYSPPNDIAGNMGGLRICHLGKYYPPAPGGIETHVQTLALAQAALGARVQVLCVDHTHRLKKKSIHEGAASHAAGGRVEPGNLAAKDARAERGDHSTDHSIDGDKHSSDEDVHVIRAKPKRSIHRLELCPTLPELLRNLEASGTQVLHLHTPNPTMLLALTMARPRIPLVITHHSDIIRQRILRWVMRPFERFVYSRATRVQATSEIYRDSSGFLNRYKNRTDVLPLGLDLKPFSHPSDNAVAYGDKLRRQYGPPLWLAVGRLVYYKGFRVALEALRDVPGTLMLIGTGHMEAELKDYARQLGVSDRIAWRGYVSRDELAGAYLASTALWFPSNARSEAFGLVQVEAMASGCPVINTHIAGSGVPWVSRDGESGLTVAVNDSRELAAAANRLLGEAGLRKKLSIGASARAMAEFDHLTMARRSLEIYHRAIAESGIGHRAAAHIAAEERRTHRQEKMPAAMSDAGMDVPAQAPTDLSVEAPAAWAHRTARPSRNLAASRVDAREEEAVCQSAHAD